MSSRGEQQGMNAGYRYVRSAVSLECTVQVSPSDFVRAVRDGDAITLALANGHEGGFSVFWAAAARLILDSFFRAWSFIGGTVDHRLKSAFAEAHKEFNAQAPDLLDDRRAGSSPVPHTL